MATENRRWSHSSSVGFFLGDVDRIETALDCLIDNAVKFTTEADTMAITARVADDMLALSVSDTGLGIPAAETGAITQPFATGTAAGSDAGTGLGLAIVSSIVEARGGYLQVESTVGRRSRFTIRMPTYC